MSDPPISSGPKQRFRAHERRQVRLAAVLVHPERGWQRDVIVFDLGLGGACVESSDVLAVGDRVQVTFVTPDRWDPLNLQARVAWRTAVRAGLAFEYPSPEITWGIFELLTAKPAR